jgi:hypothetical protein
MRAGLVFEPEKNTLLRVILTMLFDVLSGILSSISSAALSGIG